MQFHPVISKAINEYNRHSSQSEREKFNPGLSLSLSGHFTE